MTIRFIFRRDRPDTESAKIRGGGKPGDIVKNAPINKKKASKTTFPKGFSGILQKTFPEVFSTRCAALSHNDRLHRPGVRSSPSVKTVVTATKTVVTGKSCRKSENEVPYTLHIPAPSPSRLQISDSPEVKVYRIVRENKIRIDKTHIPETNRADVQAVCHKNVPYCLQKDTPKTRRIRGEIEKTGVIVKSASSSFRRSLPYTYR